MSSSRIEIIDPLQVQSDSLYDDMRSKWWRLNNLYQILDETARPVTFRCNTVQTILFEEMWFQNNILKSRQHGCTTFIDLWILDEVLWKHNIEAGIIAHREKDAQKIFERKIKYPYRHLSPELKKIKQAVSMTKEELVTKHCEDPEVDEDITSNVYVSVTLRSGTVQYLHISEFGYVCKKHPDKAEEIVTGALQAIHAGQQVWIESTAMGRGGYHHDYCVRDQQVDKEVKAGTRELSVMERKFFFFPWHRDPKNQDSTPAPIVKRMQKYFKRLEVDHGIVLTDRQKWWYIRKEADLGEKIKSEHPSTPQEAFEASTKGIIFAFELDLAREQGRICDLPIRTDILVDTWWDLGIRNKQAIWFSQDIGGFVHMVDYYEADNRGFQHYVDYLDDWREEWGIKFGRHTAPHDIARRSWDDLETRWQKAQKRGITFIRVPMVKDKMDSIEATRDLFHVVKFDRTRCDQGLECLENYRYEYDDTLGVYHNVPNQKDVWANGADSFQTFGCGHQFRHVVQGQSSGRTVQPANYVY